MKIRTTIKPEDTQVQILAKVIDDLLYELECDTIDNLQGEILTIALGNSTRPVS